MNDQNAMTEVALGLAMAFFAIFVLVLVSLGEPASANDTASQQQQPVNVSDVNLSNSKAERTLEGEEVFVLYHQGAFYDQNLEPIQLEQIQAPMVLGVMPDLPLSQVIEIQSTVGSINNHSTVAVTLLDEAWQQALRSFSVSQ